MVVRSAQPTNSLYTMGLPGYGRREEGKELPGSGLLRREEVDFYTGVRRL